MRTQFLKSLNLHERCDGDSEHDKGALIEKAKGKGIPRRFAPRNDPPEEFFGNPSDWLPSIKSTTLPVQLAH
jgi:hypothetical protein